MINYILILIFQIAFNIFKVLEIRYTYENKIKLLIMNTVWINLAALGSVFYSIESLFRKDYLGILFYIMGSIIGKWFAMTHYENYRSKIFSFFKRKESEESLS
jgi:hypothetical protein